MVPVMVPAQLSVVVGAVAVAVHFPVILAQYRHCRWRNIVNYHILIGC